MEGKGKGREEKGMGRTRGWEKKEKGRKGVEEGKGIEKKEKQKGEG